MEEYKWTNGTKGEKSKKNERFVKCNSKREDANEKLSQRDLIGKNVCNPFFSSCDFKKDIEVQEQFMKNSQNII
tara:strand:- start:9498 stop:9719 length:222 start_codon:yes stop_codon:yes gene_type:complete